MFLRSNACLCERSGVFRFTWIDSAGAAWGMTPMQTIRSETTVAAEFLNKKGVLGEISRGAMADIITWDGDPLQDIKLLEKISFVMKDGKVVKQ